GQAAGGHEIVGSLPSRSPSSISGERWYTTQVKSCSGDGIIRMQEVHDPRANNKDDSIIDVAAPTISTPPVSQTPAPFAGNPFTRSIEAFHEPLAGYLADLGLPTNYVLAPINERRIVIDSLSQALDSLPYSDRQKAIYLSRFVVAISVGLFAD